MKVSILTAALCILSASAGRPWGQRAYVAGRPGGYEPQVGQRHFGVPLHRTEEVKRHTYDVPQGTYNRPPLRKRGPPPPRPQQADERGIHDWRKDPRRVAYREGPTMRRLQQQQQY